MPTPQPKSKMKKLKSDIPYNYITIKATKSRIQYGFLTIPVSLIDSFPNASTDIHIINEYGKETKKHFVPYSSKSRECRIYGMRSFYDRFNINDGDEIVIQIMDDGKYRIIPEKVFVKNIKVIENKIENSRFESETEKHLHRLSRITNIPSEEVLKNEFIRLSNREMKNRKTRSISNVKTKEKVEAPIRKLLKDLYNGKCQITNFTFKMRNGENYFEIHHIYPFRDNHLKNILVVSPNVHAQFTYANSKLFFDEQGWLRQVKFNDDSFKVYQIIDRISTIFEKEIHH